ncbi:leucine-rich repeat domain-containing protein [Parabacteroides sp. FAFU027]|uniref:leucine-rich repeat domain-containing protein n=1 Tax=Parabacteroides sp. FAFU027 TaxID=2922715 RepID=UPI001FB037DF|nr:leucine-rich repeat domain-containing protein [Parabacteroides sp. FAFU027]
MKRIILTLSLACITSVISGAVSKSVNVASAGTLSTLLTSTERTTVTDLTVTGTIDARDFKFMRDNISQLANLNLSGVTIAAYSGTGGTSVRSTATYAANEMPVSSFNTKSLLTSITLPTSITSIGDSVFYNCIKLAGTLSIPDPVTSIGKAAFTNTALTAFSVGSGNSSFSVIDGILFNKLQTTLLLCPYGKTTANYTIPSTVTSVGDAAFYGCSGITGILTIPSSVTTIGIKAFMNCTGLSSGLTLPTSIITIKDSAFLNCYRLTGTLTIPTSVNTIGAFAFSRCSGLTGILTIPASVTSIGTAAFAGSSITSFSVAGDNPTYSSYNNLLYNKDFTTLLQYPTGKSGSCAIPGTVTTIADYAFAYGYGLIGSLTIPASVTTIGNYAFYYCNHLTGNLIIPNTVTNLGEGAFANCTGFKGSITISNALTTINDYTFYECTGLTGTLTIPSSVTSIGSSAFTDCAALSGALIIPETVNTLGEEAFYGCYGLTELYLPANIGVIPDYCFFGCIGLTKIQSARPTAPSIGMHTFEDVDFTTCQLIIPTGSTSSYQSAPYWSYFTTITEQNFTTIVNTIQEQIRVYAANGQIIVECSQSGTLIQIYSVRGQLVKVMQSQKGKLAIDLPDGIYIIRFGNRSFKVML